MKLEEIKKAIDKGFTVCWGSQDFEVVKIEEDETVKYYIQDIRGHRIPYAKGPQIPLTEPDGKTLVGAENNYYIKNLVTYKNRTLLDIKTGDIYNENSLEKIGKFVK